MDLISALRTRYRSYLLIAATVGIISLLLVQFGQYVQTNGEESAEQMMSTDWQLYKRMFVTADGRVTDTGNNNNSHSEGQGWGMLFAVKNNDQAAFDKIWHWTKENLQIRQDPLFAWSWNANNTDQHISDLNNATDGDLYIAWALKRAGQKWQKPEYTDIAVTIVKHTREFMTRRYAGMTVLLPGSEGFEKGERLLLNLSYWIFPAFKEFAQIDPSPVWDELHNSGIDLINKTRFGQWDLPSDWIVLSPSGEIELSADFPPRFSYDAIRVPLALFWADVSEQKLLEPYKNLSDHFSRTQSTPAWINLEDDSVAPYQASEGFTGIIALANAAQTDGELKTTESHVTEDQDYYSASLVMLTRQAIEETQQQ